MLTGTTGEVVMETGEKPYTLEAYSYDHFRLVKKSLSLSKMLLQFLMNRGLF